MNRLRQLLAGSPPPPAAAPASPDPAAAYRAVLGASLLGGAILSVAAQYFLAGSVETRRPGALLALVGLALMLLAVAVYRRRAAPRWLERLGASLALAPSQPILLLLAFAAGLVASLLAGNQPRPANWLLPYLAWAVSIALVILGTRQAAAHTPSAPQVLGPPWTRWERLGLALLCLAALLLRAWDNGHIPAALTGDEGSAGIMALEWVEGRFRNPFITGWHSFPALYYTLPAAAIAVLDRTYAALRAPSALAGALTVFGLYWLVRPMFGRAAALPSAIVLAALNLHLHFSRIGLNNIWDGLFVVVVLALVWRGWQSQRRGYFVAAGLVLGLSQYFYTSALLLPLLLLGWVGLHALFARAALRPRLAHLLMLLAAALVVYLPLGLFYLAHPAEFAAPMNRVSLLAQDWFAFTHQATGLPIWRLWFNNFRDAALAFTTVPLRAWYNTGQPMLLPLASGLFAVGFALLAGEPRQPRSWLLLLWGGGVIAIGALTESTPAGQRYVIAAPLAALLVGLAAATLAAWLAEVWPRLRRAAAGLAFAVVLVVAAQDLHYYFSVYTPTIGQGDLNTQVAGALGRRLRGYPPDSLVYFHGPPRMGYYSFSTVRFLAANVTGVDVQPETAAPTELAPGAARTAYVFLPERQAESAAVVARFPTGAGTWVLNQAGDPLFWIYELPPD